MTISKEKLFELERYCNIIDSIDKDKQKKTEDMYQDSNIDSDSSGGGMTGGSGDEGEPKIKYVNPLTSNIRDMVLQIIYLKIGYL